MQFIYLLTITNYLRLLLIHFFLQKRITPQYLTHQHRYLLKLLLFKLFVIVLHCLVVIL